MFCQKCGKELNAEMAFCDKCGTRNGSYSGTDSNANNKAKLNQNNPMISFIGKRIFGQFGLRKATIKIDDAEYKLKVNKGKTINILPGVHNIFCYFNFFGKKCRNLALVLFFLLLN
jgi:hypothetical protein